MGKKYAAYDAQGAITGFYDSIDSPVPDGVDTIEITFEQWQDCVATLGYTVAGGALTPPVPLTAVQLLAAAQSAQIVALDEKYVAAVQLSVSFTTAGGVTKMFQADNQGPLSSQDVLLKAFTGFNIVGATPIGFTWRSEDNTEVPFTLADLAGLYGVMLAQGDEAFRKRTNLKSQVAAARTIAAVQAVTW